jgi:autotransporter-associated beta strand protein
MTSAYTSASVLLAGTNADFNGRLTLNPGSVLFSASSAGSAAATWEVLGGTLGLYGSGLNVQLGALTGTGGRLIVNSWGAGTFTIGGNNASTVYSGVISNGAAALSITKVGTGSLTLTKTNTYTGATTVSNGTLLIDGLLPNSAVTVASGGTLGGSGTVASVTVQSGGALAAGGSAVGTLTASANVTMDPGAIVDWQYGAPSADLVAVTGTLTLPSNAVVNVSAGGLELPDEVALFTYNTLSGAASLDGWTINGADSYGVRIDAANKKIVLRFLAEGPVYEIK